MDRTVRDARFAAFVASRGRGLARLAYLLAGDLDTADDLFQEGLLAVFRAWDRVGSTEQAEAYVRRAMINVNTSWWRKRRRRPELLIGYTPEPASPGHAEDVERNVSLWGVVQRLPLRQRQVIVLRYYEGLSEAETAAVMNISIGSVKSHGARALAACRGALHTIVNGQETT